MIVPPDAERLPHCLDEITPPPVSATDTDVPLLPTHIDCAVIAVTETADKLEPTVPDTDMFFVVALVLANVIFPLGEPDAALVNLAYIVVDEIVPAEPTTKADELVPTLLANVELVDTSKPVGGVIDIPAAILVPLTVKLWFALTLPEHEVYAVKVDTDVVMFGDGVYMNMSPDVGTQDGEPVVNRHV